MDEDQGRKEYMENKAKLKEAADYFLEQSGLEEGDYIIHEWKDSKVKVVIEVGEVEREENCSVAEYAG